jgi:transposase
MERSRSATSSPPRQPPRRTAFVICVQTIERLFCRLKNWRRLATRYDRLARNYLAALALVAVVTEWTK